MEDARPDIADFVLPEVAKLICDCWATDPDNRRSFQQILRRLERMNCRLTANVNSLKVLEFATKVKEWEAARSAQETSVQLFTAPQPVT
jgi:hypothetical protein